MCGQLSAGDIQTENRAMEEEGQIEFTQGREAEDINFSVSFSQTLVQIGVSMPTTMGCQVRCWEWKRRKQRSRPVESFQLSALIGVCGWAGMLSWHRDQCGGGALLWDVLCAAGLH